jgi:hypothetical protein
VPFRRGERVQILTEGEEGVKLMSAQRRCTGLAILLTLVLALPNLASASPFTELAKGKTIISGKVQSAAVWKREFTIIDGTGRPRIINYTRDTVILATDRVVHNMNIHCGTDVIVRCTRKIVDEDGSKRGFCPLVILADRVYMDNAVSMNNR